MLPLIDDVLSTVMVTSPVQSFRYMAAPSLESILLLLESEMTTVPLKFSIYMPDARELLPDLLVWIDAPLSSVMLIDPV